MEGRKGLYDCLAGESNTRDLREGEAPSEPPTAGLLAIGGAARREPRPPSLCS